MHCAAGMEVALAGDFQWEVVPIIPDCRAGLQCERDEMPKEVIDAGIVRRLTAMTERAAERGGRLALAFMSFNEETLFQAVCAAGRRNVPIEGFFHSNAGGENGFGTRLERDCQGSPSGNVKISFMGMPKTGKSGWRLHHNKYFMVDYGRGQDVELAFGSANLSNQGLSVNFENWNFVTAKPSVPLVADYDCNLKAMREARAAGAEQDNPKVFRAKLETCLSPGSLRVENLDDALAKDGVVNFFAPDPEDRIYRSLAGQIERVVKGGRIQMAAYFFMHKPLVEVLTRAVRRGVKVELLVDDDIYSGGSIPTQRRFWYEHLRPSASGFKVRAMDTAEDLHQLQHNKFLILDGVDRVGQVRLFGGAGQFTLSAFVNNYENFFLTDNPEVVKAYAELFDKIWALADDVVR